MMQQAKPDDIKLVASRWGVRLSTEELSLEDKADLRRWLDADPAHGDALKDVLALWHSLQADEMPSEMDILRRSALSELRRQKQKSRGIGRWMSGHAAAVAATLLLVVTGGTTFVILNDQRDEVYATPMGERRIVTLSDGSSIILDADSEVHIRYRRDRRQLALTHGRASFSVAKNPMRPFLVKVEDRTVVATGTEFSVEKLNTEIRVVLFEGSVSVMAPRPGLQLSSGSARGDAEMVEATLEPGMSYQLSRATHAAKVSRSDASDGKLWEMGLLVFNDEPLSVSVERVNRYTSQKIVLDSEKAQALVVSGTYRAGDPIAFGDGVSAVTGLKFRKSDAGYRLSER